MRWVIRRHQPGDVAGRAEGDSEGSSGCVPASRRQLRIEVKAAARSDDE
ncbi:MAG TPA: hypothetical protein VKP69_06895 [Isosphaeraceae bacterium]|nr:hypothetical protein [Isosphaeraceae bacterium]